MLFNPKKDKSKPYALDYDQSIGVDTSLLDQIQFNFKNNGFDPDSIVEDDAKFNLNNPPSAPESDYEGTEGDDTIDLDHY